MIFLARDVISCLFEASITGDRIRYKLLLLETFDLTPAEHSELLRHGSCVRSLSDRKPSCYTLSKKDLIDILASLVSRLHDHQSLEKLATLATTAEGKYIHPVLLLEFLQLRISEFNEILNYEENLALAGIKDNGLNERSQEVESLIRHFLIVL